MSYEPSGTLRTDRIQPDSEDAVELSDLSKAELTNLIEDGGVVRLPYKTKIVDDFEDGDLSEYSGDTGSFAVQSETVSEGSNALEQTATSTARIMSLSGLDNYPSPGDEFRCEIYVTGGNNNWISWAEQSDTAGNDESYNVIHDVTNNEVILNKNGGAISADRLVRGSLDYSSNGMVEAWFETEVSWGSDGSITVTVFDPNGDQVQQISATDTTYSSGGIKFFAQQETYWDNYRIVDASGGGTTSYNIEDSSDNPTLTTGNSTNEDFRVGWQSILVESETWYMYYTATDNSDNDYVHLATSSDGISWTRSSNNPIIQNSASGWDQYRNNEPSAVTNNGEYWVYYSGNDQLAPGWGEIGVATGTSPDSLTKHSSNPLLSPGGSGAWDEDRIGAPYVFEWDGDWHMLYTGVDSNNTWRIGGASSTDGVSWAKYSNNPLIEPTTGWRAGNVSQACPLPHLSTSPDLFMSFSAQNSSGEKQGGFAKIADYPNGSITFHEDNPIIPVTDGSSWRDTQCRARQVWERGASGDRWRVEVTAQGNGVDQHVGYLTMDPVTF